MSRERVTWVVLAALAIALLVWRVVDNDAAALTPVSDSGQDSSPARVGQTYLGTDVLTTAPQLATVRLPIGTEHLAVSRPTGQVTTTGSDGENVAAPRDGEFVQLDALLDTSTASVPINTISKSDGDVTLAVVAGGHRYRLAHGRDFEAAPNVVAVSGRSGHVDAEVTYDGVTQRVDMASGRVTEKGAAAPLYGKLDSGTMPCGAAALSDRFTTTTASYPLACTVSWRRVPFAPGRGWATSGSGWLIASVSTSGPGEVRRQGVAYDVSAFSAGLALECADHSAADNLDFRPKDRLRDYTSVLICPAAPGRQKLHLTEKLHAYTLSGHGEHTTTVVARWTPVLG